MKPIIYFSLSPNPPTPLENEDKLTSKKLITSPMENPVLRKSLPFNISLLSNKDSISNLISLGKKFNSPILKGKTLDISSPRGLNIDDQPKLKFFRNIRKSSFSNTAKLKTESITSILNGYLYNSTTQIINQPINDDNNTNKDFDSIEKINIGSKYTYKSLNLKNVIEYSYQEDQNIQYKNRMEDKGKMIDNFNSNQSNILFLLFDGHGGDGVSNYLQENFDKVFKRELIKNPNDIISSLNDTYYAIDKEIKQLELLHVGSTGCTVYYTQENDKKVLYCANVGDTRCSLISPKRVEIISYDHRVDDPKEMNRIVSNGGMVINNRVMGQLMLSRAFGDFELKDFGVKCEPFIVRKEIDIGELNQFLIIASDGIWDVVDEEEIKSSLISLLRSSTPTITIDKNEDVNITNILCDKIIQSALSKGAWDNLSIFCIKLS